MKTAALLAAAFLLCMPVAAGEFADCHDPHWIAAAYQRETYDCDEIGRREVTAANGVVVHVRAIEDRGKASPEADKQAPLMLDTIAHALQVYDGLGLPIGDVDIVFYVGTDAAIEMGAGRETGAPVPQPMARATIYSPSECLVLMPLTGLSDGEIADLTPELRFTAAHEIVHCSQAWRWPLQPSYFANPNGWWAEGSADAIASAAVPLERLTRSFIAGFDEKSPAVPLTALAYEASPLFMWLWQTHRDRFETLMACVNRGPPGLGSTIQNQCLLNSVGTDGLNGFARAYFGRTITTLGGEVAPVSPRGGDPVAMTGDRATVRAEVGLMTLWRATFELGPGTWRVDAEGRLPVAGVSGPSGWSDLTGPADIALSCGSATSIGVYVMPTAAAEQRFTLSVHRTADADCGGG